MKFDSILSKSKEELYEIVLMLKKEMLNLRTQAKVNQQTNVTRTRECRRDVARVKTRLKQLESNG
ncbi:MAG: 50S ribosomal protein L29 [Alphaproteobacteria bacterium]|nr:50S ribosomal protein L29 [Alphaproteobacteria bacterium]